MRQQRGCWRLARGTSRTCAGWHVRSGGVPGEHSGGADVSTSLRTRCRGSRLRRGPPSFRSQPPPSKRPCRVAGRPLAASSAILSFSFAAGWRRRSRGGVVPPRPGRSTSRQPGAEKARRRQQFLGEGT